MYTVILDFGRNATTMLHSEEEDQCSSSIWMAFLYAWSWCTFSSSAVDVPHMNTLSVYTVFVMIILQAI